MSKRIENRLLQYGLTLGVFYQLYQTANGIFSDAETTLVNIVIALFLITLLLLAMRLKNVQWIALAMHLALLPVFAFFWASYGGFGGTVPSILCVYLGFIISTSTGVFRYSALILYLAFIAALLHFPAFLNMENSYAPEKVSLFQKSLDYIIIALIITLFVVFLKNKFIGYRIKISIRNRQLRKIALTLHHQNEELKTQQEEIQAINDNLEEIIRERTQSIEEKSRELSEYAFINAHMLRAPVCRIMGLINLIEMENRNGDFREIRDRTAEVDQIISSINQIVS